MPQFVAIRRRLVTTGTADITINGAAKAAGKTAADVVVVVDASSPPEAHQVGNAVLLGEGSAFPAAAGTVGDASFTITAPFRAADLTDTGFPYTFPIMFGGAAPVEGEAIAATTFSIDGTGSAAANGDGNADFTITAVPSTIAAGFTYTFPIHFGGTAPERFPYQLPVTL